MPAKKIYGQVGDCINHWQIIEYGITNPNSQSKDKDKPIWSKIKCLKCNNTTRIVKSNSLKNLSNQCNHCSLVERNITNRKIQIGQKYGKLTIIGEGEYIKQKDGKYRHFSLVQCDCGSEPFLAMDNQILNGNKKSCGCLMSVGEYLIKEYLENNNIDYIKEYSFPDLISPHSNLQLRFDFAIFNNQKKLAGLIEFDGRQHTEGPDTTYWGHSTDSLQRIQEKDKAKNQYCKSNNIPLLRIPYTKIQILDSILKEFCERVMLNGDKNA